VEQLLNVFGRTIQPIIGVRYRPVKPDNGPELWGVGALLTLLFPE
jgi:hypothetical protein